VYGNAWFDEDRLVRNQTTPAAIMSAPKRLSGRRHHATSPAKT
jgi:hypothetical protein